MTAPVLQLRELEGQRGKGAPDLTHPACGGAGLTLPWDPQASSTLRQHFFYLKLGVVENRGRAHQNCQRLGLGQAVSGAGPVLTPQRP